MDVSSAEFIFHVVASELPKAGVPFLMIGGHAVNHYGYSRATVDVDFMIASDDAGRVREVMKASGFSNVSEAENVIFFGHPDNPLRVDYLRIDSASMDKLLMNAENISYGNVRLHVPSLKDLISMKLFALSHGSAQREEKDFPDIVHLVLEHGLDLERELKPLCDRFASESIYDRLKFRISEERAHG